MALLTPDEATQITPEEQAELDRLEGEFNKHLRKYAHRPLVVPVELPDPRVREFLCKRLRDAGWSAGYHGATPRDGGYFEVDRARFASGACRDTGVRDDGNNELPCTCAAGARARFNVAAPGGTTTVRGAPGRPGDR